jgi:ribosomal protein L29
MEATAMARQDWTDDRLEERFDHLDAEIATLRTDVKAGNAELRREIKGGNAELRKEIKESAIELRVEMQRGDAGLQAELAALNRTLIQTAFGLIGALAAAILVHLL